MAAPLEQDDEEELLKDNFYSLLNVSRQASTSEINHAYKQLSKVFHPDKHLDQSRKKNAEAVFSRLKRAHEVLTDEHRRVIYDLYGEKGLENYGMEVIARTKTPTEIIEEYQRFQKEQERFRLQRLTNPTSRAVISINATDIFDRYSDDDDDDDDEDDDGDDHEDVSNGRPSSFPTALPSIEISSMSVDQTVECPLTSQDTVILGTNLGTTNGRGTGTFVATWRRLMLNRTTMELETAMGSRSALSLTFSRNLFTRCVANCSVKLRHVRNGYIVPRLGFGCVYSFDKHWQGRIKYNPLEPTSLSTILVYNTDEHQVLMQVMLSIKSSYIFASYTKKFAKQEGQANLAVRAGMFGAIVEYGVERKITTFSTVGATVSVGALTGVNLRLKLQRGQHTLTVPITLSEELVPSAVFYGTLTPILVYFAVKKLIVDPFMNEQKERDLESQKQEKQEKIQQMKREAQAVIDLMLETVERSKEVEERKNGLVIVQALYGKLTAEHDRDLDSEDCIDVTIPLQALVKESKLISHEKNPKSSLPGFYDPCIGETKQLYIKYKFRRRPHHVTLDDEDPIRLPQQKHLVRDDEMPQFTFSEDLET